jgi:hypothetical protein
LWRFTSKQAPPAGSELVRLPARRRSNESSKTSPSRTTTATTITIPTGTTVDTFFDLDVYQLAYSYSFFQDERIDLAAGIGLYVMPIDFGIQVSGLLDEEEARRRSPPPCPSSACAWMMHTDPQMVHPHRRPGLLPGVR